LDEPLRDTRTLVIQLRDRIADLIRDEGLNPGDKLPTEAQLTQRFKISRPALREALKLLEQDSIIYVEHGRGRFVSAMSAVQVDRPITVFESVTDMARHYGYATANKVLSVAEEAPDATTAEQLRLQPGERVIRLERLRLHKDEPILYCVDFIPRSIIPLRLYDVDWTVHCSICWTSTGAGPGCRPRSSPPSCFPMMWWSATTCAISGRHC